jgi:hypothetical protein
MFPLHLILIGFCFCASLLFIKKPTWADKSMPVFLLLLLSLECYCYYLKFNHKGNYLEYNLWFPLEFLYYSVLIILSLKKNQLSKILLVCAGAYLIFVMINYLFFQNLQRFSGRSYLFAIILILLCSFAKMRELINQPEINNPFYEPFFWLIIGLITVHLVGIFQFGATDYLHKKYIPVYHALQKLNLYLTNFQYVCMLAYFYNKWKFQK